MVQTKIVLKGLGIEWIGTGIVLTESEIAETFSLMDITNPVEAESYAVFQEWGNKGRPAGWLITWLDTCIKEAWPAPDASCPTCGHEYDIDEDEDFAP